MRHELLAIAVFSILGLAGCGGGGDASTPPPAGPSITSFSADRPSYWVGDAAQLTFVFANGSGRLEPDGITVTSGQTVTTQALSTPIQYRLFVTDGTTTVSRSTP